MTILTSTPAANWTAFLDQSGTWLSPLEAGRRGPGALDGIPAIPAGNHRTVLREG
jgi:hypothetical protein